MKIGTTEIPWYKSMGPKFFTASYLIIGSATTVGLLWIMGDFTRHMPKSVYLTPILIVAAVKLTFCALFLGTPLWLLLFYRTIINPLRKVGEVMVATGQGDLTKKIDSVNRTDEISVLVHEANRAINDLVGIVTRAKDSADEVSSSAEQLSASSEELNATTQQITNTVQSLAKGSEVQAQKVEETFKTMKQMTGSLQETAVRAQSAAETSSQAEGVAHEGEKAVRQAIDKISKVENVIISSASAIKSLDSRSEEIGSIVNVITKIADQTNLLALNAAIEAARAGEYGRGFAVVAEEVRELAEESANAAEKIAELIKEVQSETKEAVGAMEEISTEVSASTEIARGAGEALSKIISAVNEAAKLAKNISDEMRMQLENGEQVDRAVSEIASVAQQSAAGTEEAASSTEEQTASMEEISASAQELANMAQRL
ncbi:MAG: methyl-accepting chemotaxis protein, partial [Candidatus Bathyarchaeota archaeon]